MCSPVQNNGHCSTFTLRGRAIHVQAVMIAACTKCESPIAAPLAPAAAAANEPQGNSSAGARRPSPWGTVSEG